jgi:cytochrome P450
MLMDGSDLDLDLDHDLVRTLFDIRGEMHQSHNSAAGYVEDLHEAMRTARETGPVHPGSVGEVLGHTYNPGILPSAENNHVYSAFSFDTVNDVLRAPDTYSNAVYDAASELFGKNILQMGGAEHGRYRALVQPSFARNMTQWWIDRWINNIVDTLLRRIESQGRADLNLELCALLPLLTITSSFGIGWREALQLRELVESMITHAPRSNVDRLADSAAIGAMLTPVIESRRADPKDDLITVLTRETIVDESGERHHLSDDEILGLSRLVLTAGSGTTWRQLGIVLWSLLNHPDQLEAVRQDRTLVRAAIEEAMRWEVTDPTFHRLAVADTTLGGVDIPQGSVVEVCLAAANNDPTRWDAPEKYDIFRAIRPHLGFATGPHVCLGMHVARAEMTVALNAVLDRLPNVRWDPDAARPVLMGLQMRGPSEVPVVFG